MKPNFGGIFDFDIKSEKLEQVNEEMEDPAIWNDPKKAQDLGKEKKALEGVVHTLIKADADLKDAQDIFFGSDLQYLIMEDILVVKDGVDPYDAVV